MATKKIVPRADLEGGLGTASKRWASGSFGRIDATTISAKEYIVSSSVTQITTQQLSGSTQLSLVIQVMIPINLLVVYY